MSYIDTWRFRSCYVISSGIIRVHQNPNSSCSLLGCLDCSDRTLNSPKRKIYRTVRTPNSSKRSYRANSANTEQCEHRTVHIEPTRTVRTLSSQNINTWYLVNSSNSEHLNFLIWSNSPNEVVLNEYGKTSAYYICCIDTCRFIFEKVTFLKVFTPRCASPQPLRIGWTWSSLPTQRSRRIKI